MLLSLRVGSQIKINLIPPTDVLIKIASEIVHQRKLLCVPFKRPQRL
jgi:hypothetical protein